MVAPKRLSRSVGRRVNSVQLAGGMTVNIQGDVYAQDGYAFGDKVAEALRRRGLVAVA